MPECQACTGPTDHHGDHAGHAYLACRRCGFIQLNPADMARIDAGEPLVRYGDDYWGREMPAARERSHGIAVARAAEAILLSRRVVTRFLDIGTGAGFALDALAQALPATPIRLEGVELFPPPPAWRTRHPGYRIGRVADIPAGSVDAGMCIEVIEHLTPRMTRGLLAEVAAAAAPGACFVFNTGLAAFAREEDPGYIDPTGRGHIAIWTVAAIDHLARPLGLVARPIPGRSWCFLLDKPAAAEPPDDPMAAEPPDNPMAAEPLVDPMAAEPPADPMARLAAALPENRAALAVPGAGSSPVLELARSAMAESHHFHGYLERTRWALSLQAERDALAARPLPAAGWRDTSRRGLRRLLGRG